MSITREALLESFPRNCRVKISAMAKARGISTRAPTGIVVGHSHRRNAISVLRDGRKTPVLAHVSLWERDDPPQDAFSQLCDLLRECGATLKFHGVPVTEEQIREIVERKAVQRVEAHLAPPVVFGERMEEEHW